MRSLLIHDGDQVQHHRRYLESLDVPIEDVKARVYRIDEDPDWDPEESPEGPYVWQLDAAAWVDDQLAVSETVWNFQSWAQAHRFIPTLRSVLEGHMPW